MALLVTALLALAATTAQNSELAASMAKASTTERILFIVTVFGQLRYENAHR